MWSSEPLRNAANTNILIQPQRHKVSKLVTLCLRVFVVEAPTQVVPLLTSYRKASVVQLNQGTLGRIFNLSVLRL